MAKLGSNTENRKLTGNSRQSTLSTGGLWWVPFAIFCFALLVRLIFLVENIDSPFYNYRGIDSQQYHTMAVGFVDGTWPGGQVFRWPPLYPLFLGILYETAGQNITFLKVVHLTLGSLSCVLVYLIARAVFSGRFVPIAAAVICCLYGTLVYFDSQLLSVSLDVLLGLSVIWLLLFASRHRHAVWWVLAGVVIGLSAINRGAILLFVPVALFWMYMAQGQKCQPAGKSEGTVFWKKAVALLVPVALVIFPVVVHNVRYDRSIVDGKAQPVGLKQLASTGFLPVATNLGVNFYLGNHLELREVNNINHPEHFMYFHRIMDEPGRKGIESAFGQSRYFVRQTLRHIFEKPGDFIRLTGLKLFELFNGVEIPRNANLYAFRRYSTVLSVLLWKRIIAFPSGLIIPLGLVGICLSLKLWRKHLLLLGLIAVQFIFIVAFFVTARYRLPAIPLLAIYAAFALQTFIGYVKLGAKSRALLWAVLMVVLVLFCNSFTPKIETEHGHSEHGNLGNVLFLDGRVDEAIFHYKKAWTLAPNYSEANVRLANALSKSGKIDQAITYYRNALEHMTDCYEVRYTPLVKQHRTACYEVHEYLADMLRKQGRQDEAIRHYAESLRLNPEQPTVHYGLANILMDMNKLDEAVTHYNEALSLKPDYLEAQSNLANALAKQGKLREAIEQWERLVQVNPAELVLHSNLGTAYRRLGQFDRAIEHWEQVLRLKPDYVSVLNKLSWFLATCSDASYRDPIRAVEIAERGCKLTAYRNPKLLDSLAAAYAGVGRFDEAVGTAERALQVAQLLGARELAAGIGKRLQMYRRKQAYYE